MEPILGRTSAAVTSLRNASGATFAVNPASSRRLVIFSRAASTPDRRSPRSSSAAGQEGLEPPRYLFGSDRRPAKLVHRPRLDAGMHQGRTVGLQRSGE